MEPPVFRVVRAGALAGTNAPARFCFGGKLQTESDYEATECGVLSSPHRPQKDGIAGTWRPRRDLNPCYRRERTGATSNKLKIRDTGGSKKRMK